MLFKATILSAVVALSAAAPTLNKRSFPFDYNNQKVRGVNLGGWFVLEPWITPTLFVNSGSDAVVDEYTYTQHLGKGEAFNRLNNHWNTWIVEDDFRQIAAAGLNHVRIPIGYWAVAPLAGDPYVQGQLTYMDKAVQWARNHGIKVMIDLHGAPGSQNGFDNSGRLGNIQWQQQDPRAQNTLAAIRALAARYLKNSDDVVTAIELLNEPAGFSGNIDMNAVKQFYYDGWGNVRDNNGDTVVVIHDAFKPPRDYWNGFMNYQSGLNHVLLDTHQYQIFSPGEVSRSPTQHVQTACGLGPMLKGTDKWTVVGEWTGAQTDCAQWLNGRGKGARYDGTFPGSYYVGSCNGKYQGTVANLSADDKHNIRSFIEAQLDAYEQHTGWIFWTWRAEQAPEWNMKDLLAGGLFPQPLTARQFPNQCGY